jgi:hypothetical protein
MGSVRREIRIDAGADDVWAIVGRPELLSLWFPGIVTSDVEGSTRRIVTGAGIPMPEQIITNDPLLRRFQYKIAAPMFTFHLATIDVHDLGDGTSLVVYSTDADPSAMALVIGGATTGALEELKRQVEAKAGPAVEAARAPSKASKPSKQGAPA